MENFKYRQENRIGYLTLNRQDKYNAFNREMVEEFETFLKGRMYDDNVGVLIIDGGDAKGFCAGLDTETYAPEIAAMNLGFASRRVSKTSMMETAEELARTMVGKNPMGLRMTKEALNANIDAGGLESCLQMEDRNQMMVAYTYRMT